MPRPAFSASAAPLGNRLLAALPAASYQALLPDLEHVHLAYKEVLYEPDTPIQFVYFPLNAVVSLLTLMEEGQAVEAALIGNDGLIGLPLFLGASSDTSQAIVQVADSAFRISAAAFQRAVARDADLRGLLSRYTQVLIGQMAQGGACNRLHSLDERCARWLLQTADAVGSDTFALTQEFLASMLGVRRSSVTLAAGVLQQAGLIAYRRGHVTIRNRAGLEQATCACYDALRAIADRFLPRTSR